MTDLEHLNPSQRLVMERLLSVGDLSRPRFEPTVASDLRDKLDRELTPVADLLGFGELRSFNKYALYQAHSCEGYASAKSSFAWTIQAVRGRLAHKAIELSFASPGLAPPLDLIDRAVEILARDTDDWGPGEYLRSLDPFDVAQLKAEANDAVVKFMSDWPPVDRRWFPRVESPVSVTLCDDRIRLRGKYDLAFGRPSGSEARVIIVDFKTGAMQQQRYADDLRFYALVETLRSGIPPFRVVSYYLESGRFSLEDVTEDLLNTAARRTIDGIRKIVEVTSGTRAATLTAGTWCRFCPALDECEAGLAFLAEPVEVD